MQTSSSLDGASAEMDIGGGAMLSSRKQFEGYSILQGGQWYPTQALMLADTDAGDVMVAWDKCESTGSKLYSRFKSSEELHRGLLANPANKRWAYELIPENSACKLYADIEWVGPDDRTNHDKLTWILTEMRKHYEELYNNGNKGLEIYVCCSSRENKKDDSFKNSYHVVSPTLIFPSNHDGTMLEFFKSMCVGEEWQNAADGKCFVDLRVYTKNRCIRLPHCCKKGSSVPFTRISGDPLSVELFSAPSSFFREDDPESFLPFILRSPSSDVNVVTTAVRKKRSSVGVRPPDDAEHTTKNQRPRGSSLEEGGPLLPMPLKRVSEVLESMGDTVSNVTKSEFLESEKVWKLQCDQRKQPRVCLVDKSKIHESNNCLLFLKPAEPSKFTLEYHCTATSCKHRNLQLGTFFMGTINWEFAKKKDAIGDDSCEETSSNDTYEQVKFRFEKQCMKVNKPFCYIRLHAEEGKPAGVVTPIQISHNELLQFFVDLKYSIKDKNGEWRKQPFIQEWIRDSNKREVSSMGPDPENKHPNSYNTWVGFRAARLDPSDYCFSLGEDAEKIEFVTRPIIRHIDEVITGGNRAHTEWILDWMANLVQRPCKKTQVAICLYGKQGCGKGVIFDWLREHVLGEDHTLQVSNPERDLFSRFSDGFVNKVFIQVDEVKSLHDHSDKLKDLITSRTVNWEPKNGKMVVVPNLCNFIFTTNNENALTISSDDRRLAMFRCSAVHKDSAEYFAPLTNHLYHTAGVGAWFYKYLMGRDLSKYPYDFQSSRPRTEYYIESQKTSISAVKRYLSALINSEVSETKKTSAALYDHFKRWCDFQNCKHVVNSISFGRDISRVPGVSRLKTHGNMSYDLDLAAIKRNLEDQNEYDEDAYSIP